MSKVIFGDVVKRANTKEDRHNTDKLYYVGGEHIESNEVLIENRGIIEGSTIGPMFYFGFKAGDILFVSRNPHLRKSGIVTFDGICSEKTFVLETKDESVLLQRYLAFVMQSDHFWSYMEAHKSGSVNFFINWSTLAKYEFELPDIEKQKSVSDMLWAINNTKLSYRKLIVATRSLAKSKFHETFNHLPRVKLGEYIDQIRGVSYKPNDLSPELDSEHVTLFRANNISQSKIVFDDVQFVSKSKVSSAQIIKKGDILMCASSGSIEHVGKVALCDFIGEYTFGAFCKLLRPNSVLHSEYIAAYLDSDEYRRVISDLAQGTNINNLRNEHIDNLEIPMPTEASQKEYIAFWNDCNKSEFELKQAIDNLDALTRSILAENFN